MESPIKVLELFDNLKIKISSDGEIYTMDHVYTRKNGRLDNRKGKLLKPRIDKYGYKTIVLTKNGTRKSYTVHRLVAMAFIDNPDNKPQVNHIDGNKLNNKADNLEWCSNKENQIHKWKTGLVNYNRDNKGRFV